MDLEYQASLVLERAERVEYQQKLIESKIQELNLLINDFINKTKLKNRKEKRKTYNKTYYNNNKCSKINNKI